jgi:hypothetical protein
MMFTFIACNKLSIAAAGCESEDILTRLINYFVEMELFVVFIFCLCFVNFQSNTNVRTIQYLKNQLARAQRSLTVFYDSRCLTCQFFSRNHIFDIEHLIVMSFQQLIISFFIIINSLIF